MSHDNPASTPPGWYPDGRGGQRWWDGSQWTSHTQPAQPPQQPGPPPAQPPAQQPGQQPGYGGGGYGGGGYGGGGYGGGPGTPPAKKRTGLVIGIVVAAVLLIAGGITAAVLLLGDDDSGDGKDRADRDRTSDPGEVVEAYIDAEWGSDYVKTCELLTEDARTELLESGTTDDGEDLADCDDYKTYRDEQDAGFSEEYEREYGQTYAELLADVDRDLGDPEVREDGDEAVVDVEIAYAYTGSNDDFLEEELDGDESWDASTTFLLCKDDEEWKIHDTSYDEDYDENCAGESPEDGGSNGIY